MNTDLLSKKSDLFNKALIEPAKYADTLHIISGFATPNMAMDHITELKKQEIFKHKKINLIIGMVASEGIQAIHHKNFQNIANNTFKGQFSCSYVNSGSAVHSKIYLWLKNNNPVQAFCGSANYTKNGFKLTQTECLTECNPDQAMIFFRQVEENTITCDHQEAELLCKSTNTSTLKTSIEKKEALEAESVWLPLYSKTQGKIQDKSGLNWGQREGRNRNQAYIPIPSEIAKQNFFPPKGEHFSVLTEEGFPILWFAPWLKTEIKQFIHHMTTALLENTLERN